MSRLISGSMTHSLLFTICSPTPTSTGASTIHHFRNVIRTTTISMKTLCLEIGAGNKQLVLLTKYFILLINNFNVGCNCWEKNYSQINTHSNNSQEWQNNSDEPTYSVQLYVYPLIFAFLVSPVQCWTTAMCSINDHVTHPPMQHM